jgi:low affinity Fe/Cu permease
MNTRTTGHRNHPTLDLSVPLAHIRRFLTSFGSLASRPSAFLFVVIYALLWFTFDRDTFGWSGIATMATWTMTLFIQRAEHRDTQAIHAKLDELLHAMDGARDALTRLDEWEPKDIEEHRQKNHRRD